MVGQSFGPYTITAKLGEGGMGEVYRARDTRLKRDVALKMLPASVASDRDRIDRFEREAEVLAALNHPNIANIYGVEDAAGVTALVMELVEGEDLASRIARGPVPIDEALPLARQIVEALEAAHDRGIIHRDLKPANVKVRPDGVVKVLDFGLAKPGAPGATSATGAVREPTITSPAVTAAGVILGTAAYMSPEQARGRPVDRRADIWAFGAVMFEMLSGTRPFDGSDLTDTLASVLRSEPDWSLLPSDVPASVLMLIRRCLEKDPRERLSHLSVATFLLSGGVEAIHTTPPAVTRAPTRGRLIAAVAAALIAGAVLAGAGTWWWIGRRPLAPVGSPIRFTISAPTMGENWRMSSDRPFALSPDGRTLVYRGRTGNQSQLFIRSLDALEPRLLIEGSEVMREPFLSPDGEWVGYFTDSELRKVRVSGGPAVKVCGIAGPVVQGASWGDDDSIVFTTRRNSGLMIVPASGGEPTALTTVDRREVAHVNPYVLPQSRGVLFNVFRVASDADQGRLLVLDRASGEQREIAAPASAAQYVAGHVVYSDLRGGLHSLPFDVSRLAATGSPSPLTEQLHPTLGQPLFTTAVSGTLVYLPPLKSPSARSLVWVDRQGREQPIAVPPRAYAVARLSPDGEQIALDIRDEANDIWIWSVDRGALTRLTSARTLDMAPIWTPDGRRIVWSSTQGSINPLLYWQAADGTGSPERLANGEVAVFPGALTPDGQNLLFFTGGTIEQMRLTEGRRVDRLLDGKTVLATPDVSPDGRWVAYQSNESGRPEVYVRPYPNVDAGRWQISTEGGSRPAWNPNGRELFFLDGQGRLSVAPVAATGTTFVPGVVLRLHDTAYYPGFTTRGLSLRGYDVSPDGQRFVMIKSGDEASDSEAMVTVVINWLPSA